MSLPDRDAILAFIRQTPGAVGKREIARAFGLRGAEREALKALLAGMEADGLLAAGPGRTLHRAGGLPRVAVLTVISADGARIVAVPDQWSGEGPPPRVLVATGKARGGRAAGRRERFEAGDRILARIEGESPKFLGTVIKRLARGHARLLGVVRRDERGQLVLAPTDRRERRSWPLHHASEAAPGDLVRADLKGSGARAAAHIVERLGAPMAGLSLSAIAIAEKGIPDRFPDGVEADAERLAKGPLGPREDWTAIPFLTIDPADARDHDDAVWADADGTGWRLLVAIADVAWYVRPGSPLDRAAFDRGNSVYFPDQVVPMLPHALSSDACSLKAGRDRAALVADIRLSARGELLSASFHRARIRVLGNIAYEAAQAAIDGDAPGPHADLLAPLWGCWRALAAARAKREPLDLELPERRVVLDDEGRVTGIATRERLDAHRVIEEMMIAANVAAARALEGAKADVMYRCHEPPAREKLLALKDYLETLGVALALGQVITPQTFNRVLDRCRDRTDLPEISEAVLRAQTQAYYAPRNTGHFGLSLPSYAHFTSPIRRYADVCVHRALIAALGLGDGGLAPGAGQRFAAIGEHISFTERRAMAAERETLDRYVARHLASAVGQRVRARISGVQAFGLFATVDGIGGDGLVPVSALGPERFRFDEAGRFLEGTQTGTRYHQGQRLDLLLEAADPATGALRFALPGFAPAEPRHPRTRREGRGPRGRPAPPARQGR